MPGSLPTPERVAAGAWLRQLREEAGLAIPEMAQLVDCQKPFVWAIEKGISRFPMLAWSIWAKALKQSDEAVFARQLLQFYGEMLHDLLFIIPTTGGPHFRPLSIVS